MFKALYYTRKALNSKPENKVPYVLKTIESFGLKRFNKEKERFLSVKQNKNILKFNLKDLLSDYDNLKKLPDGSLGKEFYYKMYNNEIDFARFLLQTKSYSSSYESREIILHDLYHLLFEYNTTQNGEFSAVYTQYLQGGYDGLKVISLYGLIFVIIKNPKKIFKALRLIKEVKKRQLGLKVKDYPFEYNLATPIKFVREEIGIQPMNNFLKSAMKEGHND